MKNVALWTYPAYFGNEIFNQNSTLNMNDCLAGFRVLREGAANKGWQCHTQDVFQREGIVPDIVLFLDIPKHPKDVLLGQWHGKTRYWLLLQETQVILARNWRMRDHAYFEKIFTWHDSLVDGDKYIKYHYAVPLPRGIEIKIEREKLCTLIAANKRSFHPRQLYSERLAAIKWFEAHHPEDFDFYGIGWDKKRKHSLRPPRVFHTYRGRVAEKIPVLSRYKFAICYENARNISGYITEKILDCFAAGCVPVYLGPDNITDYIPCETFVDKRKFPRYEDLYTYLAKMTNEEYRGYLEAINSFLAGDKSDCFRCESFAQTIVEALAAG